MIVVDNVEQHSTLFVPKARLERGPRDFGPAQVARVTLAGCHQRMHPKRLNLNRLADSRRHDPLADFGVHPSELHTGPAAREQAIGITADAVARAARVSRYDIGNCRFDAATAGD